MKVIYSISMVGALLFALIVTGSEARADNGLRRLERYRVSAHSVPSYYGSYYGPRGRDEYRYPRRGAYDRNVNFSHSRPRSDIQNQIWSGIRSGRLSRAEVMELREKQSELANRRREYLADDGRIDRSERRRLHDAYNDFRGDLNHELRDGERRNYRR